jgi:hypothetical protein
MTNFIFTDSNNVLQSVVNSAYAAANVIIMAYAGSNLTIESNSVTISNSSTAFSYGSPNSSQVSTGSSLLLSNGAWVLTANVLATPFSNTLNLTSNLVINTTAALIANGSAGSPGQVLTSNGTTVYWSTINLNINTNAQYSWTNTQTFSNTITVTGAILANTVNAASHTVGTSFVANTTGVYDAYDNLRSIPINNQSSSYQLAASDNGKTVSITTGGVTVNGAVLAANQAFTIFNNSGSNQTITSGSGVTMYQAGTSNTGNRTLASYGLATILCVAANTFVIAGAGVT